MATTPLPRTAASSESRMSWVPLLVVAMAQILVVFNVVALKVSIDGIASTLGASATQVKTAIVTYSLAVACFIMPGSKMSLVFGSRRVFRPMVALFGAAMTIMVFGTDPVAMWIAQIAAGASAAVIIPTLARLVADNYRESQHAKASGWLSAVQTMTIVPAFLLAGALGTWTGWRFTFALLAVLAWATCALSRKLDPGSAYPGMSIDRTGALLAALAIVLIGYGSDNLATWGALHARPDAPFTVLSLSPALVVILCGILLIKVFFVWSRRCSVSGRTPLVAPEAIGTARERSALFSIFVIGALGSAITFVIPLYIEVVQGRSSLHTAAAITPFALGSLFGTIAVLRLRNRLQPTRVARRAFLVVAFGAALLGITIRNDWSTFMVIAGMTAAGLGEGALLTLLVGALVAAAPAKASGDLEPLCGTTTYLAGGVGAALAGALVIGVLSVSVQRHLVLNPVIPGELKAQVNLDKPSFVSNDQLRAILSRTTATPEQVAEAVRINTASRLLALKVAFFALAGLALIAYFPAGRLPSRVRDEAPLDGPGASPPA